MSSSRRPDLDAFNFLDEPVADRLQSFGAPRMKPVDGGALDERRESTGSNAEGIAHRRHTQHHLQAKKQKDVSRKDKYIQ